MGPLPTPLSPRTTFSFILQGVFAGGGGFSKIGISLVTPSQGRCLILPGRGYQFSPLIQINVRCVPSRAHTPHIYLYVSSPSPSPGVCGPSSVEALSTSCTLRIRRRVILVRIHVTSAFALASATKCQQWVPWQQVMMFMFICRNGMAKIKEKCKFLRVNGP